ncbi:PH domain-containing protein [Streptomyces sp. V4-01]|uniref:PH domain-containing protein n=1 Tax=Actinacidiphila polyblastidii TaxID=3110430 RepID=A0ABU7P999_9ACTN|nr:PH domain-containing protein [Streptomyces sp. V4-01]
MTSSHQHRPNGPATAGDGRPPQYADRVYRSTAGVAGGVLLLVLAGWLGGDAVARGDGRTPWLALAAMLTAVPLLVAFTIRPAVFAGAERIRVRNPFRTVTLPWAGVDRLRASFSTELFAGERKFQLWAIPVSLRARKRAARQTARAQASGSSDPFGSAAARLRPGLRPGQRSQANPDDPIRSWSDQALAELRELADNHPLPEGASRPEPVVRWCYEVIAPAAAGAIVLAVLLAV